MKLIFRILTRLAPALLIVITLWGVFFYFTMIDEVNDETDDALEDYSERIIIRMLAGKELQSESDGSNNSYYLQEVSQGYAGENKKIRYSDEMVYIPEKNETEPARILKTIFKDAAGQYFELTVSIPNIEKQDLQGAILQWIIFLYFTLLLTILAINVWVLHNSIKPLYALLKWLDQYSVAKNDIPLENKTTITEFKKLNEAAIRNAERNKAIFEQQKQFISNASHELQTPLAICRNRLEMLADNDSLTEEQFVEIVKTQETLDYIIRLNKSLLFLSKIDNGQFHENRNIVINDLLRKHLPDYEEAYGYRNITTNVTEEATLCLSADETLVSTLITNLLKNAFVHNYENGEINIRIKPKSLVFSNTGDHEALDDSSVFERFRQGKNKKEGSTGLGLSITSAICKMYHLDIRYFYNGKHNFEIIFP